MRSTLVLASAGLVLALTGCSFAGGALVGNSIWGDGGVGFANDYAMDSMTGTSVVCLGSDADVDDQDTYTIRGRILSDDYGTRDIGNIFSCNQQPARILTIEDDSGDTWQIGYAWYAGDGWDSTPAVNAWEGDQVVVTIKRGELDGSAGFVVEDSDSMIYVMEAGHGGAALSTDELGGLDVSATRTAGTVEDDCGDTESLVVDFESDSDSLSLYPGEDAGMEIDDSYFVTCNINSYRASDDCDDPGEVSYVLFQ
ncbi:MAG TPA: hypothetical protein QGF58_22190 [Myxococcota bacterium]|nr:hypothetical protein [Myxococcota bacterium]